MNKRFIAIVCFIFVIFYTNSCIAISDAQKQEYGSLMTAVSLSSSAIIGAYGHSIPDDFDGNKFMRVVKDKIPLRSFHVLENYTIQVIPKGRYYLLLVYSSDDNSLILFDYSCTPEVDGPILFEPGKYDVNNLQLYDKCTH